MARTAEGAALTARHHQAQLQVRARAMRDFMRLWPLWLGDRASFDRLATATLPLVRAHYRLSSAIGAAYFAAFRQAEGVAGAASPSVADPIARDRVLASLYVTGSVMTGRAIRGGQSPQAARQTALVRTSGALARLVLTGGRDTLVRSSVGDREAVGWARVTASKPCGFCAMLASRGPVYKQDTVSFQAHDHCSCSAETAYEGSEWPGRARDFRALWNDSGGTLQEFRRNLEAIQA